MTDTMAPESEAPAKGKKGKKGKADKEGGGKSNLVPAIIIAAGLLGGGYFMGGSGDGSSAAAPTTTEAPVLGEVAQMEPININLKDGHFLRVGVGLQLIEGVEKSEFEKGETARANDVIIGMLGGSDMAEIATAEGREHVKKELKKELKEVYEGDVIDVFFTDFVMQ